MVEWLKRGAGAACLLLGSAPAFAQDGPDLLSDRFGLAAGGFFLDTDTTVRFDANAVDRGTTFGWEDVFGAGDVTRFRADAQWRIGERHKLRAMYFGAERTATESIERRIEWGDVDFPVGASVSSRLQFDVYELAYEYSLLRRPRWELAGSVGIHHTEMEADLEAEVTVSDLGGVQLIGDHASVWAPLPVAGLRTTFDLGRRFWFDATAQYFYLTYDEYTGRIVDFRFALTWQPRRWLGIGIGYNRFSVDVEMADDEESGELDWVYRGPTLFFSASF